MSQGSRVQAPPLSPVWWSSLGRAGPLGDAVEGSNPSSDGVVALSNYIGSLLSKMFGFVWPTMKDIGGWRNKILSAMMAEWLRQGRNPPCGWYYSYKFFLNRLWTEDLINLVSAWVKVWKLSLNISFTLDSMGSNPVHSNKDLLKEAFFLINLICLQKIIIKYTKIS